MKFLIIEDEPPAAQRLTMLLKQFDRTLTDPPVCDSVESAVHWLQNNQQPDCMFMDIRLSDGLSFMITDQVEISCPVIFTTAHDDYALKAFELYSIDYLLKPVTLSHLKHALSKLGRYTVSAMQALKNGAEHIQKESRTRFLIKIGKRMFFISTKDIACFMADDKAVYLHTVDGNRFIVDYTLDKLMEQLDEKEFFRLNRKIIARADAINDIKLYTNRRLKLTLNHGPNASEVIVSREKVNAFKRWAGN